MVVSAEYPVLKSPQGIMLVIVWRLRSDAFDVFCAEQPVRLDHQDDDQDVEGRYLVHVSPIEELAVEEVRHVLQQSDDQPAYHSPQNAVQPAQDYCRKDLDAEEGEGGRHAV